MARNYWLGRIGPNDTGRQLFERRYGVACQFARGAVVDAACGYGTGTDVLGQMNDVTSALGLDLDASAIRTANMHSCAANYNVCDLQHEHLEIPACDWVVTLETVEHLPDHLFFLRRVKEAARQGIVLSTPIVPDLHKRPGNFHSFTPEEIDTWFADWGKKVHEEFHDQAWKGEVQPVYKCAAWERR